MSPTDRYDTSGFPEDQRARGQVLPCHFRGRIFETHRGRDGFLELFSAVVKKFRQVCHSFCQKMVKRAAT